MKVEKTMKKIPVSQYARSKGVSPQSVHKRIKKGTLAGGKGDNGLVYVHVIEEANVGVEDNGEEQISPGTGIDIAIKALTQQLTVKDQQLAEKDKLITNLTEHIARKDQQIERFQLTVAGFQNHIGMIPESVLGGQAETKYEDVEEGVEAKEGQGGGYAAGVETAQKKTPQKRKKQGKGEKRKKEKVKKTNNIRKVGCVERGKEKKSPEPIVWLKRWFKKAA
jgi:hypothetical protein